MLLAPGLSVHAFAVHGLLADDGSIDLVGLAIDLHGPAVGTSGGVGRDHRRRSSSRVGATANKGSCSVRAA
jgi:hypothetical protein